MGSTAASAGRARAQTTNNLCLEKCMLQGKDKKSEGKEGRPVKMAHSNTE